MTILGQKIKTGHNLCAEGIVIIAGLYTHYLGKEESSQLPLNHSIWPRDSGISLSFRKFAIRF